MDILVFHTSPFLKSTKILTGDNPSGTVIVYDAASSAKELQDFLEKILTSVGLDLSKVTRIDCQNLPTSITEWDNWAVSKEVLLFGVSAQQIGIQYSILPYQLIKVGEKRILQCESLDVIKESADAKKMLWGNLKLIFEKDA